MNQPLAELFRYNKWANRVLLEACRHLPNEQLDLPTASGTIRELLVHIVGGQQTFALRTQGRQHEGELNRGSAWPGFDPLIEISERSSDDLINIAASLDADGDVDLPYRGKTYRFPKSFFLAHAIEHGVEHRTEIKTTLAACGVATPDLDGWAYGAAVGYGREL